MNHQITEILLVEDNPGDVRLTRECFRESTISGNLHVIKDGIKALDFLRRQNEFAGAPRPHLILLDLNLPKKDGREVLASIKTDDNLKHIPVIVLTTSAAEQDVLRCYRLYVNCYITKPVNLDQFTQVINSINDFWLTTAILPIDSQKS